MTTYGPNGINTATKQLLQGNTTIPEDELSEATKTLLHNLPLPNVPPIDSTLYGKTSTSPRSDHLGHDHAILRKTTPIDPTADATQQLDYRMFNMKTQILNLAIPNNIVLDRWKHVINTMIEKTRGQPLLERLAIA